MTTTAPECFSPDSLLDGTTDSLDRVVLWWWCTSYSWWLIIYYTSYVWSQSIAIHSSWTTTTTKRTILSTNQPVVITVIACKGVELGENGCRQDDDNNDNSTRVFSSSSWFVVGTTDSIVWFCGALLTHGDWLLFAPRVWISESVAIRVILSTSSYYCCIGRCGIHVAWLSTRRHNARVFAAGESHNMTDWLTDSYCTLVDWRLFPWMNEWMIHGRARAHAHKLDHNSNNVVPAALQKPRHLGISFGACACRSSSSDATHHSPRPVMYSFGRTFSWGTSMYYSNWFCSGSLPIPLIA